MILELLWFAITTGEIAAEKLCRFCYGDDEQTGWLRPCKCSGSLKWVHRNCFDLWMNKAPAGQQDQCLTCRQSYSKTWQLKAISQWCRPPLQLSTWECLEVLLDVYSTYKFIRGFVWTVEGRRSIWVQCLHFFFWRTFIASNRRLAHYRGLSVIAMTSIFEIRVKDYEGIDLDTNSSITGVEDAIGIVEIRGDAN